MIYKVVIFDGALQFQVVDVKTAILIHQIGQMKDQFFFGLVLANHYAATIITDARFGVLREGYNPRSPIANPAPFVSFDIDGPLAD